MTANLALPFKTLADCNCGEDHLSLVVDNIDPLGEGGCWLWLLRPDTYGYGSKAHRRQDYRAHRFVYETLVEPIPTDLTIDHLCLNKMCVNPDHLEPVTNAENIRRSHRTGQRPDVRLPSGRDGVRVYLPKAWFGPDDPRHGTYGGYTNLACRCDRCLGAQREYRARRKGAKA